MLSSDVAPQPHLARGTVPTRGAAPAADAANALSGTDELAAARSLHNDARRRLEDAKRVATDAERRLRALEGQHLDAVAAQGDLNLVLRELAASVCGRSLAAADVVRAYLSDRLGGDPSTTFCRATLDDGRKVFVPYVGHFCDPTYHMDVPDGFGATLLEVLARFSEVFDYPDTLELPTYESEVSIYVTRSPGHMLVERWDTYRCEPVVIADGPIDDVIAQLRN